MSGLRAALPGRPVRVLTVMPGLDGDGGAERSLAATAPGLVERGVELHVAVLTDRLELRPELEAAGATVHALGCGQRRLVPRVTALRRLVRELRPDLLHATLYHATVPAQLVARLTGTPVLVTWANTAYNAERRLEGLARWRLWRAQATEIVLGWLSRSEYHAVTAGVARANTRSLLVPTDRVRVAERGRPRPYEDAAASRPPGTPPRYVLAVGRQDVQKAYPDLLLAFDEVAAAEPDLHLLVAGREGSATPEIRRTLGALRHGERVHLLGHRDDVTTLLRFAELVVCSSYREGAAGALIEAMAVGRPIVSARIEGLEGVLVDGENARVVDRTELARGIARTLHDPGLAERLADGARRTYEQRFTLEASAERMVGVFEDVVSRDGSVAPRPA